MKLRLRSFESKETLKIEVPNSCTLPQLRQILSETLPNSPFPASIRLSLNRKDDLQFDGEENLQSLGIAAGDLIFYCVEQPAVVMDADAQATPFPVNDLSPIPPSDDSQCSTSSSTRNSPSLFPNSECVTETLGTDSPMEEGVNDTRNPPSIFPNSECVTETLGTDSPMEDGVNDMEVEDGENLNSDGLLLEVVDKSFSIPGFLRKVFAEELGDDGGRDHKLVVIAVHAVMLESEFVGFDEKANKAVDGFRFRNEWPSGMFTLSLSYTLPVALSVHGGEAVKTVVLKFQSLGKFMTVYGTLGSGGGKRGTHWVRLNEDELVSFLNVVWANSGTMENLHGKDGEALGTSPEKEVFKFWRSVKDNLALPLLIEFCEEGGLEIPPCLIRLPTELKLKILELLPGVDVAKVSCTCSEFRYLGSSDDLWKIKLSEEFGNDKEAQLSWKKAFSLAWSRQKGLKLASRVRGPPYWREPPYWPQRRTRRRYLSIRQGPRIIGGHHDLLPPAFGDALIRNFSPPCNLGVRR